MFPPDTMIDFDLTDDKVEKKARKKKGGVRKSKKVVQKRLRDTR